MSAAPLDRSKIGRTSRRRGADAERSVVDYLRGQGWPDTRRYLAGDSRQPGDIDWHALVCLEVKDPASSAWPTWCRQAAAEAPPGTVPVVVRRTRGVTDVGAWPIRARIWEWSECFTPVRPVPGLEFCTIDGSAWVCLTMADLVAAVRAVDA